FPHVKIEKGAEIYDSLIMPNNHVGENTIIHRCIVDTVSRYAHIDHKPNIGANCRIGGYGNAPPNKEHPTHLFSGITLIGMESEIPEGATVGRNCIIYPDVKATDYDGVKDIPDGECIHPKCPASERF
ncbi:MAG: hypothetical protein AB1546_13375, partial [bacterium]